MEAPFQDCELFTVALFLRCCYRLDTLTISNMRAVEASAVGLLHLAHKLDAQQILKSVSGHAVGACGGTLQGMEPRRWWSSKEWSPICLLCIECRPRTVPPTYLAPQTWSARRRRPGCCPGWRPQKPASSPACA